MFGRGITLFRLFGFEVKVDWSWIILAALITWTLAQGVYPSAIPGLAAATYWLMGAVTAVGLFMSIVAHEFTHSLVARRFGLPIRQITLFIFGGVASMEKEPDSPRAELSMAIAGPIASVVIGLLFWGVLLLGRLGGWPPAVEGVLGYLRTINLILAGFNLIPAFPLDGGRVLRAALWRARGNLRRATRTASAIGSGFGIALMVLGFFVIIFRAAFISGIWWIMIGLFLRSASQSSYQRLMMTENLRGEPVSRFMNEEVVTVSPRVTLELLVEDYVYRYHYKMYPVVDNDRLMGCITTREIKAVPREEWRVRTVGDVLQSCGGDNTISKDADATEALSKMSNGQLSRLMVVEGDRLVGIVALKDLMRFLSLKVDLERDEKDHRDRD
jgi:Zn-dependent protease/predicted transcriptional regulator